MRPAVHHHGGGRHGDDRHAVANAGLQVVVPLVVGHGEQTWGGVGRNKTRRERRVTGGVEKKKNPKEKMVGQKGTDGSVKIER